MSARNPMEVARRVLVDEVCEERNRLRRENAELRQAHERRREAGFKIRVRWDRRLWSVLNYAGAVEPYITRAEAQQWMADIDALIPAALASSSAPAHTEPSA